MYVYININTRLKGLILQWIIQLKCNKHKWHNSQNKLKNGQEAYQSVTRIFPPPGKFLPEGFRLCEIFAVDANLFRLGFSILTRAQRAINRNNVATEKRGREGGISEGGVYLEPINHDPIVSPCLIRFFFVRLIRLSIYKHYGIGLLRHLRLM